MGTKRQYGPVKTEFFDANVYDPSSHLPTYATSTGGICPIPGLNRGARSSVPGPTRATTASGRVIQSVASASGVGIDYPAGSVEFDNAWTSGKVSFKISYSQKATHDNVSTGIGLSGVRNADKLSLKNAAFGYKAKLNENITFLFSSNLNKTEENFAAAEKSLSTYSKSQPRRQRAKTRRKQKVMNQLANLIPALGFGIQIKDSDNKNAIMDFLKSVGVTQILKQAGAHNISAPTCDLKVQVNEFPFVIVVAVKCNFLPPGGKHGLASQDATVKVELAFRPNLRWFQSLGAALNSSRLAKLAQLMVRNTKVLEVIARHAGFGLRVGGRAFIVVGFILGLIDIARLGIEIVKWIDIELENRDRLAQIAKTMDEPMANFACTVYARAYADCVFPDEMSDSERDKSRQGYNAAAKLKGIEEENPTLQKEPSLKIVWKAREDCKRAAKIAMYQMENVHEIFKALDEVQRNARGVGMYDARRGAEEHISLDIYGQLLEMRFRSARELADAIDQNRRNKLRRSSVAR